MEALTAFEIGSIVDVPKSKQNDFLNSVWFGNVKPHWKTGYEAVFISTYYLTYGPLMYTVVIQLPDRNGRNQFIHFENPNYDNGGGNKAKFPPLFSLRPHPIINGAPKVCRNRIVVEITDPLDNTVALKDKSHKVETISTHGGTFSPNNLHLIGLPCRVLKDDESFGFISQVTRVEGGHSIATFHFLVGDPEPIVKIALKATSLRDFIVELIELCKDKDEHFQRNTRKMLDFIQQSSGATSLKPDRPIFTPRTVSSKMPTARKIDATKDVAPSNAASNDIKLENLPPSRPANTVASALDAKNPQVCISKVRHSHAREADELEKSEEITDSQVYANRNRSVADSFSLRAVQQHTQQGIIVNLVKTKRFSVLAIVR